jgi:hypothetical protein
MLGQNAAASRCTGPADGVRASNRFPDVAVDCEWPRAANYEGNEAGNVGSSQHKSHL